MWGTGCINKMQNYYKSFLIKLFESLFASQIILSDDNRIKMTMKCNFKNINGVGSPWARWRNITLLELLWKLYMFEAVKRGSKKMKVIKTKAAKLIPIYWDSLWEPGATNIIERQFLNQAFFTLRNFIRFGAKLVTRCEPRRFNLAWVTDPNGPIGV